MRYTPSGGAVANVALATTESWKDKQSGQRQEKTEWHRVVLFNRLAEIAAEYLKKGAQVYVEGRLQTRKWQGNDGIDRYTTEIVATDLQMLGARPNATPGSGNGVSDGTELPPSGPPSDTGQAPNSFDDFDDDVPF